MIKLETLRPPTEKRLPERMVFAGLAGVIAVPVAFVATAALISAFFIDPERCGHFGCLQLIPYTWVVGRWVAVVLAWPLLYLLRVRPAWPVAVLGACFVMVIWQLVETSWVIPFGDPVSLITLSGAVAYLLAALATTPRVPWPWRILPAALFLALCVFALVLSDPL